MTVKNYDKSAFNIRVDVGSLVLMSGFKENSSNVAEILSFHVRHSNNHAVV